MAKRGPKRKVSDLRLLMEIYVAREAAFASEIEPNVQLKTTQGVRDRLNELADETEYVEKKVVGKQNLYRLTKAGETHLLAELRAQIT